MIDAEFMKILRCPIDPKREAELTQPDETHLACSRCRVRFPLRDGIPNLLAEEAQFPADCPVMEQLPCQAPAAAPA